MGTVSIVTCSYNQNLRLLRECADSVLAQAQSVHWIVVDDGSTDQSHDELRSAIKAVAARHRTTLIRLRTNEGLSAARNAALERVDTDWTVVLDSDDRLMPTTAAEVARLPDRAALACFEVDYFDEYRHEHRPIRRFEKLYKVHGRTDLDPFLWFDFYYHGVITRTEVLRSIGGYANVLRVGEDQDILLRATETLTLDSVAFLHSPGYAYRANPMGVCASRWDEVAGNYCRTMLAAARRRGAPFQACRHAGARKLDGAEVDEYEYSSPDSTWFSWHEWARKKGASVEGLPDD
jgi:glycosyltransferase involved in cell wall biosynthesis